MPFRDKDWEDFQRDCDFFPAYTDYIFGVDTRLEVADQPGLHPQIYNVSPLPRQRLYGLPSQAQHYDTYGVVSTMAQQYNSPKALTRGESVLQSPPQTPTPLPLEPSVPSLSMALLRPGELVADPQYDCIPPHERSVINKGVAQAWALLKSDAIPTQKAKAADYLRSMSRIVWKKLQEYQNHTSASPEVLTAAVDAEQEVEMVRESYAIRDNSQLAFYVQSRLVQLWTCTQLVAMRDQPNDPTQLAFFQQAQQYLIAFRASVPPEGRYWVGLVMNEMLRLHQQGEDPLEVLNNMPSVEATYGTTP
ncbi:hypothetical protein N0V94_000199 [Neodidymelliopsis sp. IMI 364377]|nr:hypothetical protein N0V94_000199 [Neodidymelliopsis sp. IMI 364377]